MKVLAENFALDPETLAERNQHQQSRRLEVKFERQKRQIIPLHRQTDPVRLNPLEEALKGAGV